MFFITIRRKTTEADSAAQIQSTDFATESPVLDDTDYFAHEGMIGIYIHISEEEN